MKKMFLFLFFCMFLCCSETHSQQIVFDPIALDEMITQTYAMGKTIEIQIHEIGLLYDSLQYQIKSLQKLDASSYFELRRFVIDRANGIKSLESRLKNINMKIDGEVYSLGDVLPTNKEIKEWFGNLKSAQEENDPEKINLCKEIIKTRDDMLKQLLTGLSQELAGMASDTEEFVKVSNDRSEKLIDEIDLNDSLTSQLQINNKLSIETNLSLNELLRGMAKMNSAYGAASLSTTLQGYLQDAGKNIMATGMNTKMSDEFYEYERNLDDKTFDQQSLFKRKK